MIVFCCLLPMQLQYAIYPGSEKLHLLMAGYYVVNVRGRCQAKFRKLHLVLLY